MPAPDTDIRSFAALLGRKEDDELLTRGLDSLGTKPKMEKVEHLGYLDYPQTGVAVMFKTPEWFVTGESDADDASLRVDAVHFYSEGYEGHKQYSGSLIDTLTFADTREVVRNKLGIPSATGGGNQKSYDPSKRWPEWDRYDREDCSVSFQYDESTGLISMATLTARSR